MPINQLITNKILLVLLVVFYQCTYAVKNSVALESDTKFLYLSERKAELENIKTRKSLALLVPESASLSEEMRNDIALAEIRLFELARAEEMLLALSNKSENPYVLANLSRLYYLANENELIKHHYRKILPQKNKAYIQKLVKLYSDENRYDEYILLMDILQHIHGFEFMAIEELAIYYYTKNNFQATEQYLEMILSANPFHKSALYYMSHMEHDRGNYENVLMYAKNLLVNRNIENKYQDIYQIAASAWMQLDKPGKALAIIQQAPSSQKQRPEFIALWRKILLILNPDDNLEALRPFIQKFSDNGIKLDPDEILLKNHGQRETLKNTIYGR